MVSEALSPHLSAGMILPRVCAASLASIADQIHMHANTSPLAAQSVFFLLL